RSRHVKRAREDCPEVADFSLVNPTSLPSSSGGGRSAAPGGSFTKTQLCKHWASGATCPWGDGCNYAHGE
ncbi:unnamed protein product, partial [Hapterophycus canaliculatus]